MGWPEELQAELNDISARGLARTLREVEPLGGMSASVQGRPCVLFCTNNYHGLSGHPTVVSSARAALERFGAGAQASRLVTGHFSIHRELEERTALFKEAEACLAFPTGFMANLAAVAGLVGEGDGVFCDRLNHASLVDACRLSGAKLRVYAHGDMESLEKALTRGGRFRRRLIVTDTLFSMDGDVAPLPALMELADRFECLVMVDDAHGTGVLGATGRGAVQHFGLQRKPDVVMGTYSKALGSLGGFLTGPRVWMDFLVNRSRPFIYTTGLPPASCGASLGALEVLEKEPERVAKLSLLSRQVQESLSAAGFQIPEVPGPIVPVRVGDNEKTVRMSERLLEEGVLVVAIRPPTVPKGTARLRVSLSSSHTQGEVEQLLSAFRKL
jgi:8-amino-7-oxononanoate synthase